MYILITCTIVFLRYFCRQLGYYYSHKQIHTLHNMKLYFWKHHCNATHRYFHIIIIIDDLSCFVSLRRHYLVKYTIRYIIYNMCILFRFCFFVFLNHSYSICVVYTRFFVYIFFFFFSIFRSIGIWKTWETQLL